MEDPASSGSSDKPTAIVTGASSGIGAAIASRLMLEGFHVIAVNRSEAAHADETIAADLSRLDDVRHVAAQLAKRPAHAFVHAAGLMQTAPLTSLDVEAGRRMRAVHLEAAEVLVGALAPAMPRGSGIVLIGSRAAVGLKARSQYGASKAALSSMARAWASELIGNGIRVNVVAPAATDTPMLTGGGRSSSPVRLPPMGRLIRPDEVAAMVAYLLSPAGEAITGQTITICGGASLDL